MIVQILIGLGAALGCITVAATLITGLFLWLDRDYEDGEGYGPHDN